MDTNLQPTAISWPAVLAARPQLIADAHALELHDAWVTAEREFNANLGRPVSDVARYRVVDGVAVIPVSGALINRYDFIGEGSGYTSYPALTREVNRAAADPAIRGIVLAISSPGGNADGIIAPSAAIRAARAAKPVTALVGSIAASGGYWLAAQAGEIVLDNDLSQVGSIGVYTMHMDVSKLLERIGIDISVISSGRNKVDGHPFAPLPADVRASIQQEVDDLRLMFAREVSTGRPALTADLALATEARMFSAFNPRTGARPAIEEKLADRMGSLSDVVGSINRGRYPGRFMRKTGMTDVTREDHDRAVAAAREDGRVAGERAGREAAATRISSIMTSDEAKANPKLASHLAYKTETSVEDAKEMLAAAGPAVAEPKADDKKSESQTYEQRKAAVGGEGYVDTGNGSGTKATAKAGWGKAVAAANKGLGPGARN
ncbi:S49 family peptidase [Bosea massiliensis]|uniref:S49 family peptidase n=1 Tax=Bosea massiliensis TaxID=151419 RepID=A0ABW0PB66_9HYPH